MPFVNGTWIDDATSVPDPSMPQGMGDPTGAIVSAPQPTPMAPQQINPRPIPGATPQLGGPPPIPPMLLNPGDPTGANIQAEPVSPALTPGMVNQEWNKLNRPPEWDAGRIASTIAKLPVTLPIQLIEGVRGLLGGDTIQGWAEQADARYSDPNYSESRAFGVKGVAKEPDYGDRWTGIITGKSQEGALHGQLMRNEIGRYTKQRTAELQNFKYVGDIYQQSQNLWKTGKELEFLPEEQQFKRDAQQRARERLELERRSSGATAHLAELRAGKMTEDARIEGVVSDALAVEPGLVNDYGRLMKLAEGRLDIVSKAIATETARRSMPDESGLTPSVKIPLLAGQAGAIAQAAGDVAKTDEQRAYEQAKIEAENARKDAETQRATAEAERVRAGGLETDLAKEARDRVAGFYKGREDLLQPRTYFGQKEDLLAQLKDLQAEQARVQGFLQSGELPRADAYAIASGDYDALATPLDQPTPMPTTVTPTPRATPTPRPAGYESPADVRARVLREEMSKLGLGVRQTPMATPSPTPTRAGAGTMSEDARRANADKLARFTPQFQAKWQAQHPDKPMRGPLYESEFKRNATANGIVVESLQ